MTPELKAKWIVTLESDNYRQGKSVLRNSEGHCCCLGVLCDIVEPDKWFKIGSYNAIQEYGHDGASSGFPSDKFLNRVELSYEDSRRLADLNDTHNNFHKIAEWIRDNL